MAEGLGAVLVAEIGSLITRVTLIDQVDGENRMIGQAETISSIEPPLQNALYAVLEATAQIAEVTGRQLLREGQVLMPQNNERDGINNIIVSTSAAGPMTLAIAAVSSDVSARSALHASRSTYTAIQHTVTMDTQTGQNEPGQGRISAIERQLDELIRLEPDAVLIVGGLDDSAVDPIKRLAQVIGMTILRTTTDARGTTDARPVIYAGNSHARDQVIEALSDRAEVFVVDNLRPTLEREHLDPTRQELIRLYEKLIMPRLPGIAPLRRMSATPIRTVCDIEGLIARYLAERADTEHSEAADFQRRVLLINAGAGSSSAHYAAPGVYYPVVLGTCGTAYGLGPILAEHSFAAIQRWLPYEMDASEVHHRLLNKLLRPQLMPATREDLAIDLAIVREVLADTIQALQEQLPSLNYNMLIAGGGILAHAPHPGMVVLALLDALQPRLDQEQPLLEIHLDQLGLTAVCGSLAILDADAAVTVLERDLLGNTPLATCIVPIGNHRPGETAVEVELKRLGGSIDRCTVQFGEIARLPLNQGQRGEIRLKPAAGVRIGKAPPGEEVSSEAVSIQGSQLGIVIDARGRPLVLAENDTERRRRFHTWLAALGVETEPAHAAGSAARTSAQAEPAPTLQAQPTPTAPDSYTEAPDTRLPDGDQTPEIVETDPDKPQGQRISLDNLDVTQGSVEIATEGSTSGRRISLADLDTNADQDKAEPPLTDIESDLDQLRQTVERPQRRGFFGFGKKRP
jgi:hypothetical protein